MTPTHATVRNAGASAKSDALSRAIPRDEWRWALLMGGIWTTLFALPVVHLWARLGDPHESSGSLVAALIAIAVFIATYLLSIVVVRPILRVPLIVNSLLYCLVLVGCLAVMSVPLGPGTLTCATFIAAHWLFVHELKVGLIATAIITAVCGAIMVLNGEEEPLSVVIALIVSVGFLVILRMSLAHDQVRAEARERIALAEEREQLAHDLHDILGHSLTTINVKAQLVAALLDRDLEQARAEAQDVIMLSRSALNEARSAVIDIGTPELGAQLLMSVRALTSASIDVDSPPTGAVAEVPDHMRSTVAWVLRETVTNVIRHSAATSCTIAITDASLSVTDNGRGLAPHILKGGGLRSVRRRTHAPGVCLRLGPGVASDRGPGTTVEVMWTSTM